MNITVSKNFVEIRDGSFEITFWKDGEIVISGIGYNDVTFGGIPEDLMKKIQNAIIKYKKERNDEIN